MNTKKFFNDHKQIMAFHGYQSFEPGEVSGEVAHEIGVKLVEELYGNRFEVIVATHVDKNHIHNHFLLNSTSFVDGKRFCNTKKDYQMLRETSDKLCLEYGLSVIKNPKKYTKKVNQYILKSFMNEIKRLKANGCHVKIIFGYKNGNKNVNGPDEIANELMKRDSLGYAKPEEVKEIVSELYNLLGKENFVYYPPLHAKIIIVDDEYMFMGSHNWLSNAGKTEEKKRAIEGTIITTSSDSISYTKEELFS